MARKPISVWTGQIIIGLAGLLFVAGYIRAAALTWPAIIPALVQHPWPLAWFLGRAAVTLASISFVGWTVVLISLRSSYGRWFGLLLLVLLFAASVYGSLNPSSSALLPSNDAERFGYVVGQALASVLFLVLVWRFGFSRPARTYFTGSQASG
jgi:hypothetical protein